MVNWHYSFSAPVNPPDLPASEPVLDVAKIWVALQRKIRHAEEFVPVIDTCEVLEDKDGVVVRQVKFKGQDSIVKETVYSFEPSWIDFHQPDGAIIRNTLSHGPAQDGRDLVLTYSFEIRMPDIEEGSKEFQEKTAHSAKLAQGAVNFSIETARRLVKEGKI